MNLGQVNGSALPGPTPATANRREAMGVTPMDSLRHPYRSRETFVFWMQRQERLTRYGGMSLPMGVAP